MLGSSEAGEVTKKENKGSFYFKGTLSVCVVLLSEQAACFIYQIKFIILP